MQLFASDENVCLHFFVLAKMSIVKALSPQRLLSLVVSLSIVGLVFFDSSSAVAQPATSESSRPNIVIIFVDDMGYGDIEPFGASAYPTPELTAMASEGRVLTDFVTTSAVCSASRSSLLTGCFHRRVDISGALGPTSEKGLNPNELTIAEICKSEGYDTAMVGKWHLGHHDKFLPHRQGFDTFYGIPYSSDMWPMHPGTLAKLARNPNAKSNWPELPLLSSDTRGGLKILNDAMSASDQDQLLTRHDKTGDRLHS